MIEDLTVNEVKEEIEVKLRRHFGRTSKNATQTQLYSACSWAVRDRIMDIWLKSKEMANSQGLKQIYYLSVEFLMGRALLNNLINLGVEDIYKKALEELGVNLKDVEAQEPDAGLGNGGLGRLAACFLDSLATLGYPAIGCSIRYEYGLFKQKIIDGKQVEVPDNWLDNGNAWELVAIEDQREVHFGGQLEEVWEDGVMKFVHTGYSTVMAIPFDMPIVGYEGKNATSLRLWSARSPVRLNMDYFSKGEYLKALEEKELAEVITKVLYPEDNHYEGKTLRLKQHYFFVCATMQMIVCEHKQRYGDLKTLPDKISVQINDTHPSLAIPELMRILIDDEGMNWDEAWDIVQGVFAYTNHTVLSEALETWPVSALGQFLPRILMILQEINERYCKKLWQYYPDQWQTISSMAIISYDQVHMANLCLAACKSVNGVSRLHTQILQNSIFKNAYIMTPDKFHSITNGITHRRWLMSANPGLCALITEAIGGEWKTRPDNLSKLEAFAGDAAFLEKFRSVKRGNKTRLADYMKTSQGVDLNIDSIFDVQAKRLHEYKRQLLNIIHVLDLYFRIEDGHTVVPHTFIFAAKASPGYKRAKLIIQLITAVADLINANPRARKYISVVFLENYNVSPAEILIPAAEVSQQISTAGKEASGTGNMKFMMNGAVTMGTMDGANVEISELVGEDNIFVFGMTAEEVTRHLKKQPHFAIRLYERDANVRRIIDSLTNGILSIDRINVFNDLFHCLLFGDDGVADPYLVLSDFESYCNAHKKLNEVYKDEARFTKMGVMNTARSAFFCMDRTVEEYNRLIWGLKKIES